jgi:hypothetical protein
MYIYLLDKNFRRPDLSAASQDAPIGAD